MSNRALLILCAAVTLLWALTGMPWIIPAVVFIAAWPLGSAAGEVRRRR